MKQKNGYVLVYVMVVIVLLCTLAAIACSISLQNLKAQNASLERTQDLYTAEGLVEQFVGQVQQYNKNKTDTTEYGNQDEAKQAARDAAEAEFETWRNALTPCAESWESKSVSEQEDGYTEVFQATIQTVGGSIRLKAKIEVTLQIKVVLTKIPKSHINPDTGETIEDDPKWTYSYTAQVLLPIKYLTYETSAAGETADAEAAP